MSHKLFEVTTANFNQQVLESNMPILVDFTADWCPPCKMIAPIMDDLARKYEGRLAIGTLDSDAHPDIVQEYGVMGLPTLILFHHGQPVERIIGYTPRDRIEARVLPYLQPENA